MHNDKTTKVDKLGRYDFVKFIENLTQGDGSVVFVIPLPPLTEQKYIVAKFEELLPMC